MTPALNSLFAGLVLGGSIAALMVGDPAYPEIPDDSLTPGAIATTSQAEVCAFGGSLSYSQAHRQTSYQLKEWIFREYGMEPPDRTERGQWEVDHRVPLCLGGADVAANLWPQNAATYHDKDALEAPDHWGDPMVAIPRVLADHTTDPAIVAWVKSNINALGIKEN